MNSALYVGWVRHRRLLPRPHAFRYRLSMLYLDLDELDRVFHRRWLWSTQRRALARFRREDHFGDPLRPLAECVRELLMRHTGRRPSGPIRLLTHPRYFGYCFNPISIYYCFAADASRLEAIVAEVTNTPWGERHCYVIDADQSEADCAGRYRHRFDKALHVSPFLSMNQYYDWRCNEPGERLAVHMDVLQSAPDSAHSGTQKVGTQKVFDATLMLRRLPLSGGNLAGVLLRFPPMTLKVVAAIYWQALRLWLKRTPVFEHPRVERPAEN